MAASQALRPFAQVAAKANTGETRGVPANGVTNPGGANDGVYAVAFTGDLAKCALSATITGATPGEITATPAAVARRHHCGDRAAFNSAGADADRPFHLSVDC